MMFKVKAQNCYNGYGHNYKDSITNNADINNNSRENGNNVQSIKNLRTANLNAFKIKRITEI